MVSLLSSQRERTIRENSHCISSLLCVIFVYNPAVSPGVMMTRSFKRSRRKNSGIETKTRRFIFWGNKKKKKTTSSNPICPELSSTKPEVDLAGSKPEEPGTGGASRPRRDDSASRMSLYEHSEGETPCVVVCSTQSLRFIEHHQHFCK